MEYRKILRMGPSSLAVILPKNWLKEHNLGPGSTVSVVEARGFVIISPVNTRSNEIIVNSKEARQRGVSLRTLAKCFYVLGFNDLVVTNITGDEVRELREFAENLIGAGVFTPSSSEDRLMLSISTRMENLQPTLIIKQMTNSVLRIIEASLLYLRGEAEEANRTLEASRRDLGKYGHLVARRLSASDTRLEFKEGYGGYMYFLAASLLGLIGEHLLVLAYRIREENEQSYVYQKPISSLLELLSRVLFEVYTAFVNESAKRCHEAEEKLARLKKKVIGVIKSSSPPPFLVEVATRLEAIVRMLAMMLESCYCICTYFGKRPIAKRIPAREAEAI